MQIEKSLILSHAVSSETVRFFNNYYAQNRSLRPYIFVSGFISVVLLSGLFVYSNIYRFERTDKPRQVVDIELVSNADFQDKQDDLPATKPKTSLGKRTSPVVESRGEVFAPPVFVIRSGSKPVANASQLKERVLQTEMEQPNHWPEIVINHAIAQPLTKLCDRYLPMTTPIEVSASKSQSRRRQENTDNDLNLEEVKPPELVEIKENEGDSNNELWQDGGHSNLGQGSSSSLAAYLKDLHKKLKHYWSPPSGSVRHIKIVFRLARDGRVISSKLMQSSGNTLADNSALSAIKEASPFGRLPTDYAHAYLDLAYTFNYTSDELTEIQASKQD